MDALIAAALAGLSVLSFLLVRRVQTLLRYLTDLSLQVKDLGARLDEAERSVAAALGRTEIAEVVLLEKGLADEEDLEAARRRFDQTSPDSAGGRDLH